MSSIDSEIHTLHDLPLGKITVSGSSGEFIVIGKRKYYRDELVSAFGGSLVPGLSPPPAYDFANPVPLGLCAFSFTTFVLSMYNAGANGVHVSNAVVGASCFYGGAIQLLAGVWDLILGNTFGGTALCSYGGFWLSFSAINLESFGIIAAYGDDTVQLENALGFYFIGWTLFTFMLVMCTVKSTLAFFSLFFSLFVTFLLLSIGKLTGSAGCITGAGVVGVICSFIGWYNAFLGVANPQNSYVRPRVVPLPWRLK
ncbi:Meiotically up-regulated protein 86 protein [Yamadazyma tenuis]|uniref:Uncharacterized protein n=1 Tax=Candida tenuis (strain ATCC 10573 / BCRC 21748 / CBS 615 / JCM 9827 / NBRC 10315 / NRRL Y-1498 / VKM Y-70) TaxID=590646 RepID=G3B1Z6_CANTC|nr:uncharacterized protein CANTEDRAFT_103245 [Yamadazyma tenuis ATCC 10573]EGV64568.1 hypothetical protein CANTEDRAFT_103245 [Yamadazyma tenuis ATCC 10573]WEJ97335.1 Meiotically up-regulated protein 86 protein [Yamadazyma tenuis]